ncbi:hypothetical protein B0T25DRAFT_563442 [Lasiosphaeria hispida]|uniref:Uncharacterized protein n=1 Tax=Lasiosphaeria hispida TaxID=260671 RepID=A0AAJ0HWY8_9PEZI|nr:hypothetical protein B0T25DRAFT_563442 [Lasiosphaeria hispida]
MVFVLALTFRKEVKDTFVTKDEFQSFCIEVKDEFQGFRNELNEFNVNLLQLAARTLNSNLKNPTLLIRSVPIPGPNSSRGTIEPVPTLFPRHADDQRHLRGSDREEEPAHTDPERAVELLEDILGLQEDNLMAFRERARQLATRPSVVTKREQPFYSKRE